MKRMVSGCPAHEEIEMRNENSKKRVSFFINGLSRNWLLDRSTGNPRRKGKKSVNPFGGRLLDRSILDSKDLQSLLLLYQLPCDLTPELFGLPLL